MPCWRAAAKWLLSAGARSWSSTPRGTTWPAPGYYRGPSRITPVNGGVVDDAYVGGTFEGYTQVLAGIKGDPVPFRVFALAAPSRLMIDVVDGGRQADPLNGAVPILGPWNSDVERGVEPLWRQHFMEDRRGT